MTVTIEEAQARLPELIDQLASGELLTITRRDRPVAQLVAPPVEKPRPIFGRGKGRLVILSEDEEPPKDFEDYMP